MLVAASVLARNRNDAGEAEAVPAPHPLLDRDLRRELTLATERGDSLQRRRRCRRVQHFRPTPLSHVGQDVKHRAATANRTEPYSGGDELKALAP